MQNISARLFPRAHGRRSKNDGLDKWVVGRAGRGGGVGGIDGGGGEGTITIIQEAVSYKNPESGNLEIRIPNSTDEKSGIQ